MQLITDKGTVIHEHFLRKVIRHGDKVTKINRQGISPAEVVAMHFIREHTTIPVPRIHATTAATITMDYVEGTTLEEAWNGLSDDERAVISDQLRDYIGQLRSIKGTYIGGFENGPAIDGRRFTHEGGPFATEAEWNDFLLSNLLTQCPDVLQSVVRSQMRTDHDIVLTHGDLVGMNIIVRDGRIASIVDWERAGFYPEYYELIKLLRGPNWRVGYYKALFDFFPCRYEPEYLIDQFIGRISRH